MRVTRPGDQERGVTTAIFALFLSAALGLSALVVDVGLSWQERRQVITATDAAALGAAAEMVRTGNAGVACSTADDLIDANNDEANRTVCDTTNTPSGGDAGWVTVEAESDVAFIFANIIGIADTTVDSSTSANYDLASAVDGGLRPFGLCLDVVTALGMTPGDGVVYRIYYGKDAQPNACNGGGNVPGNWGLMNFDGGPGNTPELENWTENGYDGSVAIGEWVEGNTGAFKNALNDELQHLVDNVDHFTLPVFSETNGLTGSNAEFLIADFAVVRLHDFKTTGAEKNRYLDIEFLNEVVQGTGGGTSTGLGAYVIGICAVDGVNPASTCP